MRALLLACAMFCGAPGLARADLPQDAGGGDLAGRLWRGLTDEAYLRVGYGIVQWAMDIERASDGATARLVHRDDSALFIGYGSKPTFFTDTNFGYTFMVNYVDFSMNRQTIPGEEFANVGTQVSGYLVYAVPTLYYQWGERGNHARFIRAGAGVGLGAARFKGTAQLSTGETINTEKKSYSPRLALSNLLQVRWNYIDLSIGYASPRVYGNGYDIKVSDFSASLGYVFYF